MCRLFGLNTGRTAVSAEFWLLSTRDSLAAQSKRNPDGWGIGYFASDGRPVIDKHADPAFSDDRFAREAKAAQSPTIIAHIRAATAGPRTTDNTHPFRFGERIFAHNGGFGEVEALDDQLGKYRELVHGDTDSERYGALITQQIDQHDGDVRAGITAAAGWIAKNLPMYSLNMILASAGELWALRYPDQRALHIAYRRTAATMQRTGTAFAGEQAQFDAPELAHTPSVVITSEDLGVTSSWRMLEPGELVHVAADLTVTSSIALPDPPARLVIPAEADPNIDT